MLDVRRANGAHRALKLLICKALPGGFRERPQERGPKAMPGPGMELIGEEEIQEVLEVLRGGYLHRYGDEDDPRFKGKVYQLEQEVARLSNVRHAVAVNSGTSALLVALAGLGIGPGDEVIVPGYTYVATI